MSTLPREQKELPEARCEWKDRRNIEEGIAISEEKNPSR